MRVLVTYGKHPKTLAAVRSIGKTKREVIVTDDMNRPLSSYSRYCSERFRTVSPEKQPGAFLRQLEEIAHRNRVDFLLPMDDPECDILAQRNVRNQFDSTILLPSPDSYQIARDKFLTQQFAKKIGVPAPESFLVKDIDSAESVSRMIGFPFVVKPMKSSGSRGLRYIRDSSQLDCVPPLLHQYGTMLVQEYVPSTESIGASFLFNDGEVRASFVHRRLLEFPESGGPSIIRESIIHPEAENLGRLLLENLKWHGIAMVEFRIDSRTGHPTLMEINPRFWGSLPLAISSGVDFPRLLCDMYEYGDVARTDSYSIGTRCVNLLPLGLASTLGTDGARRLAKIIRAGIGCRCFDVESFDDPLPMFGSVFNMVSSIFNPDMVKMVFRRDS